MIKNRTAQLIYQTIYCTLGFVGCVASLGIFDNINVIRWDFYVHFTNISNYFCLAVMFAALIQTAKKKEDGGLEEALNGIRYSYNLDLLIYTKNKDGNIIQSDASKLMQEMILEHMNLDLSYMNSFQNSSGMMSMMSSGSSGMTLWQEMLPGKDGDPVNPLLKKQYDLVHGRWPTEYNEIVLVLDENNELDDMTLYALGLKSKEDIDAIMQAAVNKTEIERDIERWTYEEICAMEFRTILNANCFALDEITGTYTDLRETDAGLRYLYDNGTVLKVTGIIKPNEEAVSAMLTGSIGYTYQLTEYVITESSKAVAVEAQKKDEAVDIFTGLPFQENTGSLTDAEKEAEFRAYIAGLDETGKAMAYTKIICIPSEEWLSQMITQTLGTMTREDMEKTLISALTQQMGMKESEVEDYIKKMDEEELKNIFSDMLREQFTMQYAAQAAQGLTGMTPQQLAMALDMAMSTYTTEQCALYYDKVLVFSDSTYEDNLETLGCLDLSKPAAIHLYASSFENKDVIEEAIAKYNESKDEMSKIKYTDIVGIMMSSITTILNAITYVLIGFVSISLIVSSIMIGVITLISVQERTKEIGILRAIGASKKNVSSMFNAETVIIGFTSGLLGVLVTYVLCIPINALVLYLTELVGLRAVLPIPVAIILIGISVLLTLFAGIIPSRSAAKKDPVVALRTE